MRLRCLLLRLFEFGLLGLLTGQIHAVPLGTAITFKGQLSDRGLPASGSYDLVFALWDASTNGSPVGPALTNSATTVSNGLFVAVLDFGAGVFDDNARWLEIGVRTNGGSEFTALTPRQRIMPYPVALYAPDAGIAGSVSAANITGTLPDAVFPAQLPAMDGSLLTGISGSGGVTPPDVTNAAFNILTNHGNALTFLDDFSRTTTSNLWTHPYWDLSPGNLDYWDETNHVYTSGGYLHFTPNATDSYLNFYLRHQVKYPITRLEISGTNYLNTNLPSSPNRGSGGEFIALHVSVSPGFAGDTIPARYRAHVVFKSYGVEATLYDLTVSSPWSASPNGFFNLVNAGNVAVWTNGNFTVGLRRLKADTWVIYRDNHQWVWQCDGLTNLMSAKYAIVQTMGFRYPGGGATANVVETDWQKILISSEGIAEQPLSATYGYDATTLPFNPTNILYRGNGSGLTNLNASQLSIGTVPLAQLPAMLLTNNASGVNLAGTFSGNGAGLTSLNISGTIQTNVSVAGCEVFLDSAAAPTAQALGANHGGLWVSNAVLYFTFTTDGTNATTVKVVGP